VAATTSPSSSTRSAPWAAPPTLGLGYNFDLAGVLGDNLAATATGANNLIDIRRAEASGALVAAPRTS
jgi:hypothetical protein